MLQAYSIGWLIFSVQLDLWNHLCRYTCLVLVIVSKTEFSRWLTLRSLCLWFSWRKNSRLRQLTRHAVFLNCDYCRRQWYRHQPFLWGILCLFNDFFNLLLLLFLLSVFLFLFHGFSHFLLLFYFFHLRFTLRLLLL